MNRHTSIHTGNEGKKDAANRGALNPLPFPTHSLSSTSIHFVCSTIFRLFWSSGTLCMRWRVRAGKLRAGRRWIYRRQFQSNFGKPLNVSYQYAMQCFLALFCVWIPPEIFRSISSFRRRVANWIWKLTIFALLPLNVLFIKTDFKFIIGLVEIFMSFSCEHASRYVNGDEIFWNLTRQILNGRNFQALTSATASPTRQVKRAV